MNKKELLEAKRAAEDDLSGAMKELREIGEAGGDLPEELKARATKANDEIYRLDKEIEGAEEREREKAQENAERIAEFEATLKRNQPPVRHTADSDRAPDPRQREAGATVLTHEFIGDMAPQTRNLFDHFGYNRDSTPNEKAFTKRLFGAGPDTEKSKLVHTMNYRSLLNVFQRIQRAVFEIATPEQGGLGMPDDQRFFGILESRRKMFMGVEKVANVIYTDNDGEMPYHLVDTTGNKGVRKGEGSGMAAQSGDYNNFNMLERSLKSYRISSEIITATNKALRSFSALTEGYIGFLLGESIGRLEAEAYVKGTGDEATHQQRGIHVALAETILGSEFVWKLSHTYDLSASDFTGIGFRIPIDMWKDLDPAYWGESGTIVMHHSFFNALRAIADSENRPIWPEMANRSQGGMFQWQSHPVVIDPNYAELVTTGSTLSNNQNVATVGDHTGFRIRKVRGAHIVRNPYRDLEFKTDSVAFVMNQYCDSNIADPWGMRLIRVDTVTG